MLQRIQTVWIFIAFILMLFFPFTDYLSIISSKVDANIGILSSDIDSSVMGYKYPNESVFGLFAPIVFHFTSLIIVGISIFMYKKRIMQARLLTFSIILIIATIGSIGYNIYNFFYIDFIQSSNINIGYSNVMPLISIVLIYLGIRRIYYDEALVRAANRIR